MNAPTTFNAIPGQDDLAAVARTLDFHPSTTTHPKVLTAEQVARFNRDGYLKPFRIFTDAEVADLRAYFADLLARYTAEGKDSYSISSAHLRHGRVWDVLTNPRVVAIVTDLLGPSVVGWGSHFFCKMPGDGKTVSWHQDASYWPLTPSKAVTVWLAIDDADRGNAAMKYIPGTHVLGHLTYKLTETDPSNVLNQTVPEVEKYGEPVYAELRAGEASVHSDLLLHGSDANESTRRRCGLTLRYTPGDVRAYMGWEDKGVIVAGDKPPHWSNRPRPTEE
ncbi:phytanoyl- dioxygenase : Phytanoyl-CoA dioxygenase OS=Solibacter usitatus (strain Ellin6076) GN=Acid_3663 PE=4 SV=1: PhyH [Gemmataceae bacterium]|nr:phytanoyl- dioxygenase : Phytanoyl-CoA dioxygenase OS=Solibacter usitatus (strain Ellin6076) GN=Acid_3663 PE=4 SV=1: PhyH [Gemmataceae bacterium]VTU00170.1 phytanoyl- dioxygenase : Phytanoyl-CoA dioxygenase OS=Solibacter usitatus (strain Ellin6076) GN=Acid_3663 PE=4 SV=1: PhyH [Gemmataceae bacterium]